MTPRCDRSKWIAVCSISVLLVLFGVLDLESFYEASSSSASSQQQAAAPNLRTEAHGITVVPSMQSTPQPTAPTPDTYMDPVPKWTASVPSGKGDRIITVHLNHSSSTSSSSSTPHSDEMSAKMLLFSTMDAAYQEAYSAYTAVNSAYARAHGYGYIYDNEQMGLNGLEREMPTAYYSRIYGAINLLTGITKHAAGPQVDWIVYLDGDAVVNERLLPLQLFVSIANEFATVTTGRPAQCDFISQDFSHIVNSGFWMIRNSTWSVDFLRAWVRESAKEKRDHFHWVDDQGPLQNTILHYASQHALQNGSKRYEDQCRHISASFGHLRQHEANMCWKRSMEDYGFPYEHRAVGRICLIPPTQGIPFRMNMHYDFVEGDFIRHQKDLKKEQLKGYKPFVKYHADKNTVTYAVVSKA